MKHQPLQNIAEVAQITPVKPAWALRRQRLERLAQLVEAQKEVRLFSYMECIPKKQRLLLRQDNSPLTIAYQDLEFRRQGLAGDRVGEAMAFFHISIREAHQLWCDCGYVGRATPMRTTCDMVAERTRILAQKTTFAEFFDRLRRAFVSWAAAR